MDTQSRTHGPLPGGIIRNRSFARRGLSGIGLLAWSFALVWLVITTLPIWWIFNIVFSKGGSEVALSPPVSHLCFIGLLHLQQALSEASFVQAYLVSLGYAFVQVSGMLLIVSMAAYEFTFYDFPGKRTLFLLALSGLMMPFAVTLIPLYRIVIVLGWGNSLQGLAVPGMASAFSLFVLRQFMKAFLSTSWMQLASMGVHHILRRTGESCYRFPEMVYLRSVYLHLLRLGATTHLATGNNHQARVVYD